MKTRYALSEGFELVSRDPHSFVLSSEAHDTNDNSVRVEVKLSRSTLEELVVIARELLDGTARDYAANMRERARFRTTKEGRRRD